MMSQRRRNYYIGITIMILVAVLVFLYAFHRVLE